MQHVDVHRRARGERIEHDAADDGDGRGVDQRAWTDHAVDRRLALTPALHVDVGVVADQAGGPADFAHDIVAGVNAQAALNATELDAVADVDAGRTDVDALVTVDAVVGEM